MNKTIAAIVVLVVLIGGYLLLKKPAQAPVDSQTSTESGTSLAGSPEAGTNDTPMNPKTYTVTYSDAGYSPAELNIKVGDTVVWKNESSGKMWTASGPHPAHTNYDGTDLATHCAAKSNTAFDQCENGESYSFTFTKAGTWPYHNHSVAGKYGKIVVE